MSTSITDRIQLNLQDLDQDNRKALILHIKKHYPNFKHGLASHSRDTLLRHHHIDDFLQLNAVPSCTDTITHQYTEYISTNTPIENLTVSEFIDAYLPHAPCTVDVRKIPKRYSDELFSI